MTFHFRNVFLLTAGAAVGMAASVAFSALAADKKAGSPLPLDEIRQFSEVFGAIKGGYVDPVDDGKLFRKALAGMLAGLDPHSCFLDEQDWSDMQVDTKGEFGGLGMEVTSDDFGVRVVTPIDDTPAARAGVHSGDIITKLDGESTQGMTLSQAVKRMRGKPKTDITITIARKGATQPLEIKITRDIIKIRSVKSKTLPEGIGYIRISQFQGHTVEDFAKAVRTFSADSKIKALVVDLRNNPGGLLDAAIGVCAALLDRNALVVSTKGQLQSSNREFRAEPQAYLMGAKSDPIAGMPERARKIPVAVLVNGSSASASEIVSGALQDHKRAKIIGLTTFGKGSVQTVLPLRGSDRGIKMTTARYYTPSGRSIQAKGITPDIEVEDTDKGNYESFEMRESDLAGHLEAVYTPDTGKKQKKSMKDRSRNKEKGVTGSRYAFGSPEDFQLKQAVAFLTGGSPRLAADARAERLKQREAEKARKEAEKKASEAKKSSQKPAAKADKPAASK